MHVSPVGDGIGGDVARIDDRPSICVKRLEIGGVRRVDVQRNLERLSREAGQSDDLSEFMHLEAVCPAVVSDRPKRPAPGSHRRKSSVILRSVHRPLVEYDEPSCRTPLNAARRDRTCGSADVLAHREVQIVGPRRNWLDALLVPELRETGIFVEVGEPSHAAQHRLERQVPRDVDQHLGASGGSQHIIVRDAVCVCPLVAHEARRSLEAELPDDTVEEADVGRLFEARRAGRRRRRKPSTESARRDTPCSRAGGGRAPNSGAPMPRPRSGACSRARRRREWSFEVCPARHRPGSGN